MEQTRKRAAESDPAAQANGSKQARTHGELPLVAIDTQLSADVSVPLAAFCHTRLISELLAEGQELERQKVVAMYTLLHPTIDGSVMDKFPNLKAISNYGVGVDHIDLPAAKQRNIRVGNTPGVIQGTAADLSFALILAVSRQIVLGDRFCRAPDTREFHTSLFVGTEVNGKTIGVVGMGNIGKKIARRAFGFEMRILYHCRNQLPAQDEKEYNMSYCADMAQLLQESDFVVLSVPLTPDTQNMITEKELRQMKPSAFLVNVARGPVVNTADLTKALQQKWIAGAGLDVTDPEPLPRDHALLGMENVVFTPHLGSAARETRQKMAHISVVNLQLALEGQPMQCPLV